MFVLLLEALLVALSVFISSSFLSLIFFNPFKTPPFLSSSLNPCSIVLGFRPKSSPVNNSYLSRLLEESADLSASLNRTVIHFV